MKNADRPISRLLTRRTVLALFRAASAATLVTAIFRKPGFLQAQFRAGLPTTSIAAAAEVPNCIISPEQTEGPYFIDEQLNRSDIRSDPSDGSVKAGIPLQLVLRVVQVSSTGCTPIQGAIVDIWHCDALGVYSDVTDPHFNTVGKKFLRGYQVTNENGIVQFTTIYPGWYPGRTVHVHILKCAHLRHRARDMNLRPSYTSMTRSRIRFIRKLPM